MPFLLAICWESTRSWTSQVLVESEAIRILAEAAAEGSAPGERAEAPTSAPKETEKGKQRRL
jgi:hypothetical protein